MKITLTRDQLDNIEYKTEDFDLDAEFQIHYSGRFMYGDQCVGVVTKNPHTATAFLYFLAEELEADFLDLLSWIDARTDSMGLSTITYWPGLTVEPDEEENE